MLEMEDVEKFMAQKKEYPYYEVSPELLNPYAVGQFINHPPPDVSANVSFVDFDLPHWFFPSTLKDMIPFMDFRNEANERLAKEYRQPGCMKAVGIVAQRFIEHGEELYVNYFEENLCPLEYQPDWLIEPPPPSPYLTKKESTVELPYIVKLGMIYKNKDKKSEFVRRVESARVELPIHEQQIRKKAIGEKLQKLKELKQKDKAKEIGSDRDIK